ncbi:BTAD domain-containing putative transcriptional regulator [Streptomyces sp. NBC_00853]|uniref:BTAD domain-containing putative transcriptional regulator n=1 Tax=Streptomyces sp. NBC_00853 TaxID=2903681 RepID=UPI003872C024
MGRKERPIASSNRALVALAQWLRDQRLAGGYSYAELAARAGCHATTLQRAASGRSVPSAGSVRAYARACGASEDRAMALWRQARRRTFRSSSGGSPNPLDIDGIHTFQAGLRTLYELAGRPSVREMERRAGTGRLPHSTAHRIVRSRTVPRDIHQLTGFLTACGVAPAEHLLWIDAWRCALGRETPFLPAPRSTQPVTTRSVELVGTTTRTGDHRSAEPVRAVPERAVPVSGLYFAVLGPVRAWDDGQPLASGSPQQRALLAALLLREGRTATAGELIDAIWGEEPPSQALATVRTYASRLRKQLGHQVLISESGGYAIRLPVRALDTTNATALCMQADRARAAGDLDQGRTMLRAALGLWEGEPLAGVPGPYAEAQRTRLEEWRLQILEACLDMDLAHGRHAQAVSELTALTAAHPLRERLRELLILALYRSGRQAEALAVYADTRRLLADELGVDPRPELADLQHRILRADATLNAPLNLQDVVESNYTPLRPSQLPATVADFTGRASVQAEMVQTLTGEGAGVKVAAISGTGGVGKTTLAVQVGHVVRQHFPDGQLYVDLREGQLAAALGSVLRTLGVAEREIPDSLGARSALFRSVLDGRRVLLLLDHAQNAAQVRWLLPASEGCGVLVTSDRRMVDLAGAHLVELDVMSPDEALEFFTRIAGERRVHAELEDARYVVAACGFLPLAIRIAASRLVARRTWTIGMLASRLSDESRRLAELQAGDLAVRTVLERGYARLDAEQARAFRLLSSSTSSFISLSESASLLDRDLTQAEDLLESLIDTGLLMTVDPDHYQTHVLARLYALTVLAP